MANIFNKTNQLYENPNRNTFQHDHSFHGTFNFGDLYPVMCKEIIPGTSVSINPTIALKMMPMLFPIQSRIKAYLHFFYVPYRTLWKDWMDFIGDTKKGLNKPFIDPETTEIKTGYLADYLGLPTTVSGFQMYNSINLPMSFKFNLGENYDTDYLFSLEPIRDSYITPVSNSLLYDVGYHFLNSQVGSEEFFLGLYEDSIADTESDNLLIKKELYYGINELYNAVNNGSNLRYYLEEQSGQLISFGVDLPFKGNPFVSDKFYLFTIDSPFRVIEDTPGLLNSNNCFIVLHANIKGESCFLLTPHVYFEGASEVTNVYLNSSVINNPTDLYVIDSAGIHFFNDYFGSFSDYKNELKNDLLVDQIFVIGRPLSWSYFTANPRNNGFYSPRISISSELSSPLYADRGVVDISELPTSQNPYFDFEKMLIDAGPFRAYESIYNTYYRDDRNNPRIVNGEPVYNKFIPNDEGGLDSYPYKLHKRNWEQDFLTLSVQSPQQGIAPLVGITSRGEFQFKDEENGRIYTAQANYSSDGDTIESFTINSADMPQSSLKQLMTYATEGISISDLRNVNALQRWLEINMRRGYRYKDQIKSHFGVDVRYDELMLPEFIGGMSSDIFVNQINNTAQSDGNPLGAFAGQGSSINKSDNTIHHYCQEHGYIIGILSISPTANYSQLLPKHFTKREILDYYFPEFGHIGFQPISYREVAPLSAFLAGKSLDDTFGYQRAWYDYLASTDSVHGLFRTNLKNFVVQRIFNSYPELSPEFLTIDHKDLDDIFAVESSDVSHKFFGEIFFDMKMKLPIPEYGTPKLEV